MTESLEPSLRAALEKLSRSMTAVGAQFAISGGVAVGVWARQRQTKDIDVCGTLPPAAIDAILAQLDGMRFGAGEVPDALRFEVARWEVDFFIAKADYERTALSRAVLADVDGLMLRVVTPEDLLIQKLIKLKTNRRKVVDDLADMRSILDSQRGRLDFAYLRSWLSTKDADMLEALSSIDDDELLKWLSER